MSTMRDELEEHWSSPNGCHPDCPACEAERFECQNCGDLWREDQLKVLKDAWERVQPGDVMPDGECPKCGAACFEIEEEPQIDHDKLVKAVNKLLDDYPRMGFGVGEHIEALAEIVGRQDEEHDEEE